MITRDDLIKMLAQNYSDFVQKQPVSDIIEGRSTVNINLYIPQCFCITDTSDFQSEDDRNKRLKLFAKQIAGISGGKLLVTYCNSMIRENSYLTWIYIMNRYEL